VVGLYVPPREAFRPERERILVGSAWGRPADMTTGDGSFRRDRWKHPDEGAKGVE